MSQTQLAHIKHEPHNPAFNFICIKSQTPPGTAFQIRRLETSRSHFQKCWFKKCEREKNTLETDKRRLRRQKQKDGKLIWREKKSVLYLITGNTTAMPQHCKKFS